MRIFYLTTFIALFGFPTFSQAQGSKSHDKEAVKLVIETFFNAMRKGDSALLASTFHESAQMASSFNKEGEPLVSLGSKERFIQAVGTPHDKVWDERIDNLQIRVDDGLANAWMDYSFYLGDAFSHCGVNTFTLINTPAGWKITYIADTRRKIDCRVGNE